MSATTNAIRKHLRHYNLECELLMHLRQFAEIQAQLSADAVPQSLQDALPKLHSPELSIFEPEYVISDTPTSVRSSR
jgi:hypothetical protein